MNIRINSAVLSLLWVLMFAAPQTVQARHAAISGTFL